MDDMNDGLGIDMLRIEARFEHQGKEAAAMCVVSKTALEAHPELMVKYMFQDLKAVEDKFRAEHP